MINLIPPQARSQITAEYWVRVVTVWLFLLAVIAVLAGAFLLPSYVLVTSQVRSFAAQAEIAKALVAEGDGTARVLVVASEQARLLLEIEKTERFTTIIEAVKAAASNGIELNGYDFSRTTNAIAPVQVSGTAITRQAFATFRDALLEQSTIATVNLPISNFAKDRDIDFSLTLMVASSTPVP